MNYDDDLTLYAIKFEFYTYKKYEYFLSLEKAIERFNYLTEIDYISKTKKTEIKAIRGVLTGDYIKGLEDRDSKKVAELEQKAIENYPHAELIKIYPRAKKLRDMLPYVTAPQLSALTGMTLKASEKLIFEEIKFESFSTHKLSLLCKKLNLSVYLFLE